MTDDGSAPECFEDYGFVYGDMHVPYRVERKAIASDKLRKITIRVTPDSRVVVSAPEGAQKTAIHEAVMKRAKWIHDSRQSFNEQQTYVQPRRYVSGEMQFYLGRRHVLKVEENPELTEQVKMTRGKLLVSLPKFQDDKPDRVRELVKDWYRIRAQQVFTTRLEHLLPQTRWVKEIPAFRILSMEKQWGSCSARGTLMLNPHLVKAPRDCIDYVILHELCHIEEHNHGERFYRLLGQVMPEWRGVKQQLDGMAELLLNE
ncbi:M48 family metallopeptidase [Granulosicoccus antarcticus]|uniref:YgjP-like metallopeptidase domain-containing protein n=1 Tax=Granulosicoccus antarcticus IMCC3135 TaxID=1192854 RepID=A0A2Z2P075_9GAMM|nr:SprT family zinc-dependent metalloprotease [Granulosicoccus antarcticus]ASJ72804.1 hypothetical protein IMCC3135_13595 [Granulosicoccus antarcticus IMCC3135]